MICFFLLFLLASIGHYIFGGVIGWNAAKKLCASKKPRLDLCPYDVLCPSGEGGRPIYEIKLSDKRDVWVPILNHPGKWVQISDIYNRVCQPYGHDAPHWSNLGCCDNNEILCCQTKPGNFSLNNIQGIH